MADSTPTTLGTVCELTKGTYPTEKTPPGPYPLIVTAELPRTSDSFQLDGEAVCIPIISSTGHGHASLKRVHYARGKIAVANLLVAAQPRPGAPVDARWLWLYLNHRKDSLIVPLMRGTANVSLKPAQLAEIPLDLPSLAQQRRIVDLIGAVDGLIAAAEVTADSYTRTEREIVSHEWHEMRADETPVASLAGTAFGRGFRDGDWIESKDQSPRTDDAVRLIQLADIGVGEFLDRSDRWIAPSTFQRLRCTAVLPGDLLICRMADPAGRTARIPARTYRMVTAVDCTIVRLDPEIADSDYWLAMLNSPDWLSAVDRLSTGSTRRRITRRNLERIRVPVVALDRQIGVGALLAAAADAAASARNVARVLTSLRRTVLADLLSGEHEIPASYDRFLDGAA
jgi:hypothetical protein